MRVRVWGCRGSVAAPGAETVKYGGNTSCVEVRLESGHVLVLDAGTGMRALGVEMQRDEPDSIVVLLTHLHLDHLQGLGFFRPLYVPGLDISVWGPASPVQKLAERIAMYLSPPLFPVHLDDVQSFVTFHDAPEEPMIIGSGSIRASKVQHQGPTVGYRIEENGRSFVYLPDHEPSLGNELRTIPVEWMSGYDIACDADVLFHDAQYRDHEYGNHIGWGHSSIGDTMEFALKSNVDRLVLFHHDPYHTDEELEELLDEARMVAPELAGRVCLAYEGMTIDLDARGTAIADRYTSSK